MAMLQRPEAKLQMIVSIRAHLDYMTRPYDIGQIDNMIDHSKSGLGPLKTIKVIK